MQQLRAFLESVSRLSVRDGSLDRKIWWLKREYLNFLSYWKRDVVSLRLCNFPFLPALKFVGSAKPQVLQSVIIPNYKVKVVLLVAVGSVRKHKALC